MIPRDFFFSYFHNLWHLFWIIPLLGIIFYANSRRKTTANQLIEPKLQRDVMIAQDRFWYGLSVLSYFLAWGLAVLAMMGPMGNEHYLEKQPYTNQQPSLEIFLLIDVSQSMGVADGRSKKTRLESAIEIADRLVAKLKNDSVAVFAFTSALVPFVPLTYDRTFVRLMIQELQLNEGDYYGTKFPVVFEQLKKSLFENYPKAAKAIVLFSDGGDDTVEAAQDRPSAISSVVKVVKSLKVPVFSVGIGTKEGGEVPNVGKKVISRFDEALLSAISRETGGRYFSGNNQSADEIADRINQSLERPRTSSEGVVASSKGFFQSYFQIPLALAIALFGAAFLMPTARKMGVILLFFSIAEAADPGNTLFETGHYAEASDWYRGELKHLPPEWLRNKLLYNLGTSLMAEKKWEEASHTFFAITEEAYTYPLFRLRLLYNQIMALYHQNVDISPLLEFMDQKDIPKGDKPLDPILLLRLRALLQKSSDLNQDAFNLLQLKMEQAKSPHPFLQAALDQLAIAYSLPLHEELVAKNASRFYPLLLEWQKKKFAEGICQCHPWDQALPSFSLGERMLQEQPFDKQIPYTYEKWIEALKMMQEAPPSKQEEEKPEESDIRELREMQTLDKQPAKAKMKPVGGIPW